MKTWILAAVMMMGMAVSAQPGKDRPQELKPEQRAELRTKQMALALDLNEKQQKEVSRLLLDRSKKAQQFKEQRKASKDSAKKLTSDEHFAMKSKMLDEKIAMKSEMKKILTPEQFEKWQKMKNKGHRDMKKGRKNHKKHERK